MENHTTGLIPCAVGATSSHEWMPNHVPSVAPTNGIPITEIYSPLEPMPLSGTMYVSCYNYLSCLFRMFYRSLYRHHISSTALDGLLWYQGCNDAGMTDADEYATRILSIFAYMKQYLPFVVAVYNRQHAANYTLPIVPVIVVTITTTRPWLQHTPIIRNQQLQLIDKVDGVVDALGGVLCSDSVHLNAEAQIQLGVVLAETMHEIMQTSNPPSIRRLIDIRPSEWNEWVRRYDCVRSEVELELSNTPIAAAATTFPVLSTGLKAVNFVYGEITFSSALHVLHMAVKDIPEYKQLKLFDLGCGSGVMLIAGIQLGLSVVGVEMMKSKVDIARKCYQKMTHTFDCFSIIEGNFLEVDWSYADLLYICATCYAEDQMAKLRQLCCRLKPKSRILVMDKYDMGGSTVDSAFRLVCSCQCETTWGIASVYLYEKLQ